MLQKINLFFINCIHFDNVIAIMVAITKTMDYFIYKNYLLHHNKQLIYIL